jgi:hypothetical protein
MLYSLEERYISLHEGGVQWLLPSEKWKGRTLDVTSDEQPSGKRGQKPKSQSQGKQKQAANPQPKVPKQDVHPFDNLSKALFEIDGAAIIPELVEGAQVVNTENVELDRSKLKADMVYRGPFGFSGSSKGRRRSMIWKCKLVQIPICSIANCTISSLSMSAIAA